MLIGAATLVAGCGGGDGIAKETFIDGFVTKSGLTHDQAVCVTDRLYTDLSSTEIRTIHAADDWETLSPKERQAIVAASTSCLTPDADPFGGTGSGMSTGTGGDAPVTTGSEGITTMGTDGPDGVPSGTTTSP